VTDTVMPGVTDPEASAYLHDVVKLELDHWIPNASQRLIKRAHEFMGVPYGAPVAPDCGPRHRDHALVADWVAHWYVMKCATCGRLFDHS